jgi:hypothetical protein
VVATEERRRSVVEKKGHRAKTSTTHCPTPHLFRGGCHHSTVIPPNRERQRIYTVAGRLGNLNDGFDMYSRRACDACRRRKVKCDAANPCSGCCNSQLPCIYSHLARRRGPRVRKRPPESDISQSKQDAQQEGYMIAAVRYVSLFCYLGLLCSRFEKDACRL